MRSLFKEAPYLCLITDPTSWLRVALSRVFGVASSVGKWVCVANHRLFFLFPSFSFLFCFFLPVRSTENGRPRRWRPTQRQLITWRGVWQVLSSVNKVYDFSFVLFIPFQVVLFFLFATDWRGGCGLVARPQQPAETKKKPKKTIDECSQLGQQVRLRRSRFDFAFVAKITSSLCVFLCVCVCVCVCVRVFTATTRNDRSEKKKRKKSKNLSRFKY